MLQTNFQNLSITIPFSTKITGFSGTRILNTLPGLLLLFCTGSLAGRAQSINPGIIDPTNSYAGRTYSQWAAGWWQHYMSLPATNNPFNQYGNHPAPLSLGQNGPVWYLGGYYAQGGAPSFTNTIPGGVGLFVLLTDVCVDHAACPTNNTLTEAQLRAMAKADQDQAFGMSCTIDGVAVSALANHLTTPYRVQSVAFSYTCPPVHNIQHDVFGLSCYQTNTGIPFSVDLAVEDGVFLMVEPLSAGNHVIHVTGSYTGGFTENWTHHLAVQPVALTVGASPQPGYVYLSWPQSPDTYGVERSSSLSSPNWQADTNLTVTLSDGVYSTTAPIWSDSQFFRLRVQ